MKALLVRGALFSLPLLGLLAALQAAVLTGARHSQVHQPGKVNLLMQHRIDPELAIFGSSNALTDFDAPLIERLTGLRTFNMGLDGMPFVEYQALLREFIAHSKKVHTVVLAETFLTFDPLPAVASPGRLIPYVGEPAVYQTLEEIDAPLAWRLSHVPLYSFVAADAELYRTAARGALALLGRPPADDEKQGFQPVDALWRPMEFPGSAGPSERIAQEFDAMIGQLIARGIEVVVVVTPVASECQATVPGFQAHRRRLREILGARGRFLDYSQHPIAADHRNFYNCGHLNVRGAEAFSRAFVQDLQAARR